VVVVVVMVVAALVHSWVYVGWCVGGGGGGGWATLAFGLGMLCDDRAVVVFGVLGEWMVLLINVRKSW